MNKLLKDTWTCERCGKDNKVWKVIKKSFVYSILHTCNCGKKRVVVYNFNNRAY